MIKKKGFNLLKNQVEPQTIWTKLYSWTTNVARAIMVFVELSIVLTFAFRVVVDLQFKNFNNDIADKEEILLIIQDSEKEIIKLNNKAKAFNNLWEKTPYTASALTQINSLIPTGVEELSVTINSGEIFVRGFASPGVVSRIENSFKNNPTFAKTELINVETQGSGLDSFTLRTQLVQIPTRKNSI